LSSYPKVTLIVPYGIASTVIMIGVPREGTVWKGEAGTSCIQDSPVYQITGFNKHKTSEGMLLFKKVKK